MKRRDFVKNTTLAIASMPLITKENPLFSNNASIRLLRHATLVLTIGEKNILVDPLLADKEAYGAIGTFGSNAKKRNPLVNLPIDKEELEKILKGIDAILVTHTHTDHWDKVAIKMLDKDKKLFCQPQDLEGMKKAGFKNAEAISATTTWQNIKITRTGGQHGTGEIAKAMAPVSGFIVENDKHKIYVAGDTIWCNEVKEAIEKHQPTCVIVNAGGAQFNEGEPITMNTADVITTIKSANNAKVVAVHMDTINHCHITRKILQDELQKKELINKILIPTDGEIISLT